MTLNIVNNLYPPIIQQWYSPAFIYTEKSRIYFSISLYNTLSEIKQDLVQVVVKQKSNNQNVLNKKKYPNGILFTALRIDSDKTENPYYIEIRTEDIENGFSLNEDYCVQIRFTSIDATPLTKKVSKGIIAWLTENLNCFSEWSTVVLIHGISRPVLELEGFNTNLAVFKEKDIPVIGTVTFENTQDKETVKSYRIYLYNNNNNLLEDSGDIYFNQYYNTNQINYNFNNILQIQQQYILKIQIITNHLYSWDQPKTFEFIISRDAEPVFDVDIQTKSDDTTGRIFIKLINKYQSPQDYIEDESGIKRYYFLSTQNTLIGRSLFLTFSQDTGIFKCANYSNKTHTLGLYNKENMYHDLSRGTKIEIKRTSSKDNFAKWDSFYPFDIIEEPITNIMWTDYTVQPGVWYKYYIVRHNIFGERTSSVEISNPMMVAPEDIFLNADGKQLKIRFDPQITTFSHKVSQGVVETIGSQFPFVRRNGNLNYKTFNLSGTITAIMDIEDNLFKASKPILYQSANNLYTNYNQQNNIRLHNDYIYERDFREKVIEFLYKNNVKLFRSLTEGNILIKLTGITLTPNQTLSRLIYTFSCVAQQVDECTAKNYNKYNIIGNTYQCNIGEE